MTGQGKDSLAAVAVPLAILVVAAIIMAGCGSTQLVSLWKDPSYNAAPLHKIMVVAIRKDQVRRRMWEDAVVAALSKEKAGTLATASYQLFPNEIPDTTALQQDSKDQGFDGVLVVARVERSTLTSEVPSYVSQEPVTEYKRRWNAYVTHYETIVHQGYVDSSKVVSVRTDLLLVNEDGRMVWSATSRSVDPSSAEQFRSEVAENAAKQLAKARLVP